MKPSRVIAVDIGNTNTDIGVIDTAAGICVMRATVATASIYRSLGPAVSRMMLAARLAAGTSVIVSTVVGEARSRLALPRNLRKNLLWVEYRPSLPISIKYRRPERLGADRLADLVYAHVMYPKKDVIVVDAGTTITVNLLTKGKQFAGGVIMPGIAAQLMSMHRATSQLPQVEIENAKIAIPGRSTEECLRAGALLGAGGGTEMAVRELSKLTLKNPLVLATGGSWPMLMNRVDFHHTFIPSLTLVGIGLFSTL